jgi:chromosome segregation ATPase
MTGEEVERAIETLLDNQATFETQLERTNQQIEQTNRQIEQTNQRLEMHAETQTEFMQIVLKHIESQGEANASIRDSIGNLTATVDRYITARGNNGSGGA